MFTPDHERYEGVRPINVWLLRLFYFLIAAVVAYPLWRDRTLATSPTNEMAHVLSWVLVVIAVVPWSYVWRTYIRLPERAVYGPFASGAATSPSGR